MPINQNLHTQIHSAQMHTHMHAQKMANGLRNCLANVVTPPSLYRTIRLISSGVKRHYRSRHVYMHWHFWSCRGAGIHACIDSTTSWTHTYTLQLSHFQQGSPLIIICL